MASIDTALNQFNYQRLSVPNSKIAREVDGQSARLASGTVIRNYKEQPIDRKSELFKESQEFESLFVKMMLTEMNKSVEKAGLVDGGNAEDIFKDMLTTEYSKLMSKTANLGLAEQIYRQLEHHA